MNKAVLCPDKRDDFQWLLKIEKLQLISYASYTLSFIYRPSCINNAMWCQFHIYLFIVSQVPLNRIRISIGTYERYFYIVRTSYENGWDWERMRMKQGISSHWNIKFYRFCLWNSGISFIIRLKVRSLNSKLH